MARDWPHRLDPEPSFTARRWQAVERIIIAILLIGALLAATVADAGRRKSGGAKRVRSLAVRSMPSATGAFRSCAEARAAGAAPVRRGSPGYSRRLDRDGDGVGCE